MRPAPALFTLLGAGAIFLLGCGGDQNQLATGVDGPRPSFQQDCSLWPEGCPDDPVPPPGPGYHIGSATTPALCFSKTGVNISDTDLDGMDDGCEERLASLFRPSMTTAPASYDCDPQIEPYWAVKYFPSASNWSASPTCWPITGTAATGVSGAGCSRSWPPSLPSTGPSTT